jgi:DNA-binding NarL/FixJ family response regulator
MLREMSTGQRILHVCSRDLIRELRDNILQLKGYEVVSTLSVKEAVEIFGRSKFDLVLVDVEGDGWIPLAEKLCEDVREKDPQQKIAFVCNYRVSKDSSCPDEIIHSDFDPEAMVQGVREALA